MNEPVALPLSALENHGAFIARHVGIRADAEDAILREIGYASREALMNAIVPAPIRLTDPLALPPPQSEAEALSKIRNLALRNRVLRSFIGQGYYDTLTPG